MTQLAENHHAKKSTKSNSNIVIAILDFSLLLLRKVNLLNYQHVEQYYFFRFFIAAKLYQKSLLTSSI